MTTETLKEVVDQIREDEDARPSQALIVIESVDTDLIIASLEGRAVREWAYRFDQDGQAVMGLTVAGVEECSRESAKRGEALRIESLSFEYLAEDQAWAATVMAGRYAVRGDGSAVLLDTTVGTKTEATRKWSRKKRAWYSVPNARDVAASKAVRNAKRKLLDAKLQEHVLNAALSEGRVAQVAPERQRAAAQEAKREQLPPPPKLKIDEDTARRRFYATASDVGLVTQEGLHQRLGLACAPGDLHDAPESEGPVCHVLRDAVEAHAAQRRVTRAEAWDYFAAKLPEPDEDIPFE